MIQTDRSSRPSPIGSLYGTSNPYILTPANQGKRGETGAIVIKKSVVAVVVGLMLVPFGATVASASDVVDTNAKEKVECLFRVYIQEGGESGLDCLT